MQEIFKTIPNIKYEGPDTENPLAFRYYNPEHRVQGKKMSEHMRFSMAFWHSMNATGADPFGAPTAIRPWDKVKDDWKQRETKIQAIFELTTKLQIPFFCFHDRDIAPEGATLRESNQNLDRMVGHIEQMFKDYPTRLLWGTAQLFLEPRYMEWCRPLLPIRRSLHTLPGK